MNSDLLWGIWGFAWITGYFVIQFLIPTELQSTAYMYFVTSLCAAPIILIIYSSIVPHINLKKDINFEEFFPKIKEAFSETEQEYISIKAIKYSGELSTLTSKFGGVPYITKEIKEELDTFYGDNNYMFLAQINFNETPKLKDFPESGLLQFYIRPSFPYARNDDDTPADLMDQAFVKYIENPDPQTSQKNKHLLPDSSKHDEAPFGDQFKLEFEKRKMMMSLMDYRFDKYAKKIEGLDKENRYDFVDAYNEIKTHIPLGNPEETRHQIGGYPYFTQADVRDDKNFTDYVLLFEMDSQFVNKDWEIIWGDAGVANFFIDPADLKKKDFSKVLFTWDCS